MPSFSFSMAKNILRLNHQNKAFYALGLFYLMLLMQRGGATEFTVGGSKGWTVPTDPTAIHYNQWAEMNRFQIGDTLLFVYPPNSDSVLQVTQEDYINCNTDSYIAKFSDGHTVFAFNQSGPYCFVSGNKDNCLKNEKMMVIVMADRSSTSNSNQTSTVSPPPPPSMNTVPPSPAPESEAPPSPPTAPVSEPPPPSGASSIFMSFIGSIGAFSASSILLIF